MRRIYLLIHLIIFAVIFNGLLFSQENSKVSPRMLAALQKNPSNTELAAWVFFTDKGHSLSKSLSAAEAALTSHAYQRRLRNRGANNLVDEYDIPLNSDYLREISQRVSRIRHPSRWLNAVSVEVSGTALQEIAALPFVKQIDLVFRTTLPPDEIESPLPREKTPGDPTPFSKTTLLDYGDSFTQNNQINVTPLHDQGFTGEGVIIGIFDTGFNNLQHEALAHLHILATRDFVNNDGNVSDEPGQMGSGNHGTNTLSVLGGLKSGRLIGPAYRASYLLAKTENTDWERHIEEDHWVAAAEWADSLGADIISSSVGYNNGFTNGEEDYSWEDMDGETTIVTRGANIAASRGILIVNSAGNDGSAPPGQNTLIAPADGKEVLAVGAVNSGGQRTGFSSVGPTADHRTKPDLMAMGSGVTAASAISTTGYTTVQGTSFSCPLTAGAAALILQTNPGSSNLDIIEALRETASNSFSPNNSIGWGIIDAKAASDYLANGGVLPVISEDVLILQNYPNPFNSSTRFRYNVPQAGNVKVTVYNALGQKVTTLLDGYLEPGTRSLAWSAEGISSGIYIVVLTANGQRAARKMVYVR